MQDLCLTLFARTLELLSKQAVISKYLFKQAPLQLMTNNLREVLPFLRPKGRQAVVEKMGQGYDEGHMKWETSQLRRRLPATEEERESENRQPSPEVEVRGESD